MLSVGTVLLDRVVLTGVLFRSWDRPTFELWSAVAAVAGLLAMFELGFNLYVNNRLTSEIERGRAEIAERILAEMNTVLAVCALAALACLACLVFCDVVPVDRVVPGTEAAGVLVLMSLGTAGRILACGSYGLYRANRQYARLTVILSSGEFLRILLTGGIVLVGGGMFAAAMATSAAVLGVQIFYILWDSSRRFPRFAFRFRVPSGQDLREVSKISFGYFAQNVPFVLLTHLPVIALAQAHASAGALSAFILVRTLTGLPRSILQALGIVAGQETGRRIALEDHAGAFATVQHSARAFAVISGLSAGSLLAAGGLIGTIWTGNGGIFTFAMLAAGLTPMLLAPHAPLNQTILGSTNSPWFAAIGRWLHLAIAATAGLLMPVDDLPLRALLSLALGEVVGFAIVSQYGVRRLVRKAHWQFTVQMCCLCLASAAIACGVTFLLLHVAHPAGLAGELAALTVSMAICAVAMYRLGLERSTRIALFSRLSAFGRRATTKSNPGGAEPPK